MIIHPSLFILVSSLFDTFTFVGSMLSYPCIAENTCFKKKMTIRNWYTFIDCHGNTQSKYSVIIRVSVAFF